MTIPICCPRCHRQYAAPDHAAGRTIKCPRCKALMEVPTEEEPQLIVLDGPPQAEPPVAPPVEQVVPANPWPPADIPIAVPVARPAGPPVNSAIPVAPVVGIPVGPVVGIPVGPVVQPVPSVLDFLDEAAPPPARVASVVVADPIPAPLAVRKKKRRRHSRGWSVHISWGFWIGVFVLVGLIGLVIAAMVVKNAGQVFAVGGFVVGLLVVLIGDFLFLKVAWDESPLYAILMFVPFIGPIWSVYFLISRWEKTAKPFYLRLLGGAVMVPSFLLGHFWDFSNPPLDSGDTATRRSVAPLVVVPSISPVSFPDLPPAQRIEASIQRSVVRLPLPPGQPGSASTLYVYTPPGNHPARSLPCVFIAPAGTPLICGMLLGEGDVQEHLPYVRAGFAVVAYELDGPLDDLERASAAQARRAFDAFSAAQAGLVNACNAIEYTLARVPQVDPSRLYTAGHSSAGTMSLLVAEHDPRIKGCIAFAPASDLVANREPLIRELGHILPGLRQFFQP